MKVCIMQPAYSTDYAKSDAYFEKELALLDQCDGSMDLIVMPESCDIPCLAKTKAESEASVEKYNAAILTKAAETAKRCNAVLFVNARLRTDAGYRNTTYAFDRNGDCVGHYFKQHLVPGEVSVMELDSDYSFEFEEPTVIEIDGLRFGFLTCYDFYFYENFAHMARKNLDIIIGCSHQRSDSHDALETMCKFLAYNTNAYVVRSSVSLGEDSEIGGCSMIVAPDGKILANMKSRIGMTTCDIDPAAKYYKPAGFGNPPSAHYEYIEKGRRPWKYRHAGSSVVKNDDQMGYPRICAHRGFNTIAPENSMPAFGAAVAMGADEIEFDLWATKDGEIVSIHDPTLERVSDGQGFVWDYTYEELLKFDFGIKHGDEFRGMKILRFEEILQKFACRVIMNIHVKTRDFFCEYDRPTLEKIVALIDKYDCRKHVYFMCGNDNVHALAKEIAPDIHRGSGGGAARWEIVERAIRDGNQKVQFFKPDFDQAMIDKAHAHGIKCNLFWADDGDEAVRFLEMGIDTILTNDYNRVAKKVQEYLDSKK